MFIYLEMPKFAKKVDELETKFDKWLFVLKNLNKLDRVPDKLREDIFIKLFEVAEIAKFEPDEYQQYEDSLKYFRDLKNSFDTAREEGFEKGIKEGIKEDLNEGLEKGELLGEKNKQIEIARGMKHDGLSIDTIAKYTGLTHQEIEKLDI